MRDPKVERYLDKLLVKWNYKEKVPLSKISFDTDSRNSHQIRFNLIDEQNYHNMMESRRGGDEMYALVVNETDTNTYLLDGNHRYSTAQDSGLKNHDCYIVSVEPGSDIELQIMLELNTRLASKQLEENEAIRWAIYLNTHYKNLKQAEIARRVGLKPSQVSHAIQAHKAFIRAQKVLRKDKQLFNSWMKLTPTIQKVLNRVPNDVGLRYAIEVAVGYQLNSSQIQALVQRVSDSGTDQDAVKCIDAFLEEETSKNTAKRTGAGREKPAWDFLKMHAGAVRNVSSERVLRELMSGTLDEKQVKDLERYLTDAQEVISGSLEAVSEYRSSLGKLSPSKRVPAHLLERKKSQAR